MPPDDERSAREAVRAFDLLASALANPVPRLMADLTAPGERLRELDRDPPLATFSPFAALPNDIADYGGEPAHPPVEVTPSDARWTGASGDAEDLSPTASPETPAPVFSFRRSSVTGSRVGRRDRDAPEDPVDAARGHFNGSGTAQEASERPVDSTYQEPPSPERSETTFDYGDEDSGSGARPLADPMSLLDGLAEDALAPMRDVPLHPANAPLQSPRSREPGERGGEAGSVEGPSGLCRREARHHRHGSSRGRSGLSPGQSRRRRGRRFDRLAGGRSVFVPGPDTRRSAWVGSLRAGGGGSYRRGGGP